MKHVKLFEELINEIGDASRKPFKWKLPPEYSDVYYNSPEDFMKAFKKDREDDYGYTMYQFTTDKGTNYEVEFNFEIYQERFGDTPQLQVEIDFYTSDKQGKRNLTQDMTHKNEIFPVMATVVDIVVDWINQWDKVFYMRRIDITPKREDDAADYGVDPVDSRRGKLYLHFIKKQLKRLKNKKGKYMVKVHNDFFKIEPSWYAEDE